MMTPFHEHSGKTKTDLGDRRKIVLIGNPNVGKSVIFGLLTGKYVTVSNYPGTTVEITAGAASFDKGEAIVIDTPGTNNLIPASEDELVARNILLSENIENIVQVADAKNLRRALFISVQLSEANLPFVLNLNMIDEAKSCGIEINTQKLAQLLGVDICPTIATQRKGIKALKKSIAQKKYSTLKIKYDEKIEDAIEKITPYLPEANISKRSLAVMLFAGDENLERYISSRTNVENIRKIREVRSNLERQYSNPLSFVINLQRYKKVDEILSEVLTQEIPKGKPLLNFIGSLCVHPVFGFMMASVILYLTYQIVGVLGAGICVDFLEETVFGKYINPIAVKTVKFLFPHPLEVIQEALVGDYGVITVALTYSFAIILPIVGFFFIIFGILEDSGYLPRLAFLVNRIFKAIGLTGKAVLPMILGLGCGTMAILTTRILPTKKERIIASLLLALAIPCSAQLGVIFGETAAISGKAFLLWLGTIFIVIIAIGYLASKVVPGDSSDFILEVPPMRIPKISNIVAKTIARLQWYIKEAVPLFILGTFLLFVLYKTGILNIIQTAFAPISVNLLSLPKESANGFILGFLRRDYATVLITKTTALTNLQKLVAVVTITLFVPCIAQFFVMIKERGLKTALLITVFVFSFAFLFGGLYNFILRTVGIKL